MLEIASHSTHTCIAYTHTYIIMSIFLFYPKLTPVSLRKFKTAQCPEIVTTIFQISYSTSSQSFYIFLPYQTHPKIHEIKTRESQHIYS